MEVYTTGGIVPDEIRELVAKIEEGYVVDFDCGYDDWLEDIEPEDELSYDERYEQWKEHAEDWFSDFETAATFSLHFDYHSPDNPALVRVRMEPIKNNQAASLLLEEE